MSTSGPHHAHVEAGLPSGSRPPPAEASINHMVPTEQAVQLLQELISKASVRLHDTMRRQSPTCHLASTPTSGVAPVPKTATLQQMQRLLDRLGSEAYKELEQQMGFKLSFDQKSMHPTSCSDQASQSVARSGKRSLDCPLQQTKEYDPQNPAVVHTPSSTEHAADGCDGAQPTSLRANVAVLRNQEDAKNVSQSSFVSDRVASALHSTHNVHMDQHIEYLGASKRPGSPSRPACFDVYQGYRQRGASWRTNLNLREHESGVPVCWIPGGRHQGTFNKYGATQAAAGINRKTCVGMQTSDLVQSSSAQRRSDDNFNSQTDLHHPSGAHSLPPASDALTGSHRCSPPQKPWQNRVTSLVHSAPQTSANSADTLDSPQARLTFDLRASRLIDPHCTGCNGPRQRSFSNPQIGHGKETLPADASPSKHRHKWPQDDQLSLTMYHRQQGTERMVSPTETMTESTHGGLECGESGSNVSSSALQPLQCSPSTAHIAIGSHNHATAGEPQAAIPCATVQSSTTYKSSMGQVSSGHINQPPDTSDAHVQNIHDQPDSELLSGPTQEMDGVADAGGQAPAGMPAAHLLSAQAPAHGDAAHPDRLAVPSPERLSNLAAVCSTGGHTHDNCERVVQCDQQLPQGLVCAPCCPWQSEGTYHASSAQLGKGNVQSSSRADGTHALIQGYASNSGLPARSSTGQLDWSSSLEAPNAYCTDGNFHMRQHLDKAYRIVSHLSSSAELMQKLHNSTCISEKDAADGAAAVEAAEIQIPQSQGFSTIARDQQTEAVSIGTIGSASFTALGSATCEPPFGPQRHARARVAAEGPASASINDYFPAQVASFNGVGTDSLTNLFSWEHSRAAKVDIGRARSLNSAATRVPYNKRPSDAIVNRVDEIQRSVERLRQVHVATRSCGDISTSWMK